MGVVVAVPDRRQLDLPPRSLVLSRNACRRGLLREGSGRAQGGLRAQLQRPVRGLGTFGLRSLRRQSDAGLVASLVARHKQGMLARAAVSRREGRLWLSPATREHHGQTRRLRGCCPCVEEGCMRYKVGAEQLEQVPSMVRRPNGVFRSAGSPRSAQPMPWPPLRSSPLRTPPPAASRPPTPAAGPGLGSIVHRKVPGLLQRRPCRRLSVAVAWHHRGSSRPRAGHPGRRSRTTLIANTA